jgi:hypothetical protein
MALLLVAKPVEGWSSVSASQILGILGTIAASKLQRPPKEEKPKEEPKEEKPKEEKSEDKRSGGYVKSADGCAIRGKTKGKMV